MRLIRAIRKTWQYRAVQSDLERASFHATRAADRLAALNFPVVLTFTASGVPAVAGYTIRAAR